MAKGHLKRRTSKDGKVSYQVTLDLGTDPTTGKRIRQYHTVNGTKREAEAYLERMKSELANGGGNIVKPSAVKLSSWMQEWLDLYLPNIEETTRAGYTERIKNRLNPYLGNYPLNALRTATIQQWVKQLSQDAKLSPKSVKNVYLNLKSSLDKAVTLNMLASNPCTGVVLPKLQKYQAEVYDEAEIKQLMKAAEGTDIYPFVALTVSVGFRRGEICALTWDDVDLENGIIHINKNRVIAGNKKITKAPKSQAGTRDISIGDNLIELLKSERQRYLDDKYNLAGDFVDSNCVIRQRNGEAYSPDSLTSKWNRFCKSNGLKHIRLHDLRHTCATTMASVGISPKVMQTRLGHADVCITINTYTHCLPSMNKEAGDKLDAKIMGDI